MHEAGFSACCHDNEIRLEFAGCLFYSAGTARMVSIGVDEMYYPDEKCSLSQTRLNICLRKVLSLFTITYIIRGICVKLC